MEKPMVFQNHGQQLVGILHTPDHLPAPGILMLHGFTGHKIESHRLFVRAARRFADAGFVVFRFDFRGSGDSEGRFEEMTLSGELDDAIVALKLLKAREEVIPSRIGVVGFSMGGCIAAMLAGRFSSEIDALALWAAASENPPDLFNRFFEAFESLEDDGDYKTVEWAGYLIGENFVKDLPNIRPTEEIRKFDGDVLIVHGTDDQTVSTEHALGFYNVLKSRPKGNVKLHLIEDASHTFIKRQHEEELFSITVEFFRNRLF